MKKIKILICAFVILCTFGCFRNDSMENVKIATSVYPIQYVVDVLYGEHSEINSIYPNDSDIENFKVTNVLLNQYNDSDLFIFNGLSEEKNYVKTMLKNNENLKIIDVTSNMQYDYESEELWLDPNNLLTIANNIKKGFEEYIKSTYLINEINENYDNLKMELTNLDGKYYSAFKSSNVTSIIVSDDSLRFLEKYGIKVISIDPKSATDKDLVSAKELVNSGMCNYIFTKYGNNNTEEIQNFVNETGVKKLDIYTFTNLSNLNVEKNDYLTLMNQNLENLKLELYK